MSLIKISTELKPKNALTGTNNNGLTDKSNDYIFKILLLSFINFIISCIIY